MMMMNKTSSPRCAVKLNIMDRLHERQQLRVMCRCIILRIFSRIYVELYMHDANDAVHTATQCVTIVAINRFNYHMHASDDC